MNALTSIADSTASGAIAEAGNIAGSNVGTIAITVVGIVLFTMAISFIYKFTTHRG